jgi:hypothetical protein
MKSRLQDRASLKCPSAQHELSGVIAIGVVDHSGEVPEVAYLDRPLPVSEELLDLSKPLRPTELFRFAAPCQEGACAHWSGQQCKLAKRIVALLPAVTKEVPKCNIRSACRWYAEQGRQACFRCPQVVTQNENPSDPMLEAAEPN